MKTALTTKSIVRLLGLTSLVLAIGCGDGDPNSDKTQDPVTGARAQCDDEGEEDAGPNDKVYCSVDTDCDSDEVCMDGRCTGVEDEDEDACEDDEDDEDEDDEDEDDEDEITCVTDADCEADEYCTDALCTGMPESCASDADCDSDEACTSGLCEDR